MSPTLFRVHCTVKDWRFARSVFDPVPAPVGMAVQPDLYVFVIYSRPTSSWRMETDLFPRRQHLFTIIFGNGLAYFTEMVVQLEPLYVAQWYECRKTRTKVKFSTSLKLHEIIVIDSYISELSFVMYADCYKLPDFFLTELRNQGKMSVSERSHFLLELASFASLYFYIDNN